VLKIINPDVEKYEPRLV
jgi:hypothetical protein